MWVCLYVHVKDVTSNMIVVLDSPESQSNDAVTKMQTIWWLFVNYFLHTDVTIPQALYITYFFVVTSQLQTAVNSLECIILDFHTLVLCSFVSRCDYVSFDLVTPTLPWPLTHAHTFIQWAPPLFSVIADTTWTNTYPVLTPCLFHVGLLRSDRKGLEVHFLLYDHLVCCKFNNI